MFWVRRHEVTGKRRRDEIHISHDPGWRSDGRGRLHLGAVLAVEARVGTVSGSTDLLDAQCDRILEMTVEELAASEGLTVPELLEEGRKTKERVLAFIRERFPDFGSRSDGKA